ncbi:hypothetical protein PRtIB026_A02560 [Pseudomonas sp. RtIB026]|uniref:RHS repeat-associated core domain-containing protein n=1 Tax=Pseudomonas sp. RtIB026 TaxID=2749999 RepID=UPI0019444345|nr:RHS repeat-associated core domain-containing protein [Pseudomonas sp. RtIB026]BCJ04717.1 hypothetical protein PRtIB026_A02560 [Pseudomonas sp. RtIB026]
MPNKHHFSSTISLLTTDIQGSVLRKHSIQEVHELSYTAYGFDPPGNAHGPHLRFSAESPTISGTYLLGKGYRAYSPMLMRFHSPDNLSPFEDGNINAYAYCSNDPVNYTDPSGHMKKLNSIQDQLRPIVKDQIFHQENKTNKINELSKLKKNQPKMEARLQTIATELETDRNVYGKEKMHHKNREKLETEKSSLLSNLVRIDKLPFEINLHEAELVKLDKKNDAIEGQIGKAKFNEQFEIAFQAVTKNNSTRQNNN